MMMLLITVIAILTMTIIMMIVTIVMVMVIITVVINNDNKPCPAHAELDMCWESLVSPEHPGIVASADMMISTIRLLHLCNPYRHALFLVHSLRA